MIVGSYYGEDGSYQLVEDWFTLEFIDYPFFSVFVFELEVKVVLDYLATH